MMCDIPGVIPEFLQDFKARGFYIFCVQVPRVNLLFVKQMFFNDKQMSFTDEMS